MPGKIETQKYKSEIEANPILHTTDCSLVKSEERKTLKTLNLRYTYKERNKLNDEENFVDTPFDIWKKFIFGNQIQFSLCSILKNLPLNSISSITSWPTLLPKRVATGSLKEQEDDEVETVARKEEREREREREREGERERDSIHFNPSFWPGCPCVFVCCNVNYYSFSTYFTLQTASLLLLHLLCLSLCLCEFVSMCTPRPFFLLFILLLYKHTCRHYNSYNCTSAPVLFGPWDN